MTTFINTAEAGVASGTSVPATGQAAGAGTAFTPTKGATGVFTYDSTHTHRGGLAYKAAAPVDGDIARMDMNVTATANAALEYYGYITAYPSVETTIAQFRTSSASVTFINMNSSGQLRVYNNAGTAIFLTTNPVPLNAWWRIAIGVGVGTTTSNGTIRFAYYSGTNLETSTVNETFTQIGTANTGIVNITVVRALKIGSSPVFTIWGDDVQWSDSQSTFIGPVVAAPPVASGTLTNVTEVDASNSSGSGSLTYTLVRQSGPAVTITGPVNGIFRVVLPTPMTSPVVVRLTATDTSAQSNFVDYTIAPNGGTTTVIDKDFLVYNGSAWV